MQNRRKEVGRGQSWGKKMCGLMVVRLSDNRPCTKGGSFVRNIIGFIIALVVAIIPVVGFIGGWIDPIIALIHARGQRLGDMVAKTQVIEKNLYQG